MSIRALGALLLLVAPAFAASYRFRAVWDGDKVHTGVCVNTREDRIESIGACPTNAIDMSRYTAIPGLIDVHTHMTNLPRRNPVSAPGRDAAIVYLAASHARKTLETGVTTVRDLGVSRDPASESAASGFRDLTYPDIAMRDLINAGQMTGPRMFVAGYGLQIQRGVIARGNEVTGPAEVARFVRQQFYAGVDHIKMFGSTGGGPDVSQTQTFTYDEMKAAVDAAHALGKRIAIHSYGPDGARDAVRAGADSLEHATDIDDATIAEMVRRKTWYVPTIDHNRYYVDNYKFLGFPDKSVGGLNSYIARNLESAKRAWKAGVGFATSKSWQKQARATSSSSTTSNHAANTQTTNQQSKNSSANSAASTTSTSHDSGTPNASSSSKEKISHSSRPSTQSSTPTAKTHSTPSPAGPSGDGAAGHTPSAAAWHTTTHSATASPATSFSTATTTPKRKTAVLRASSGARNQPPHLAPKRNRELPPPPRSHRTTHQEPHQDGRTHSHASPRHLQKACDDEKDTVLDGMADAISSHNRKLTTVVSKVAREELNKR